MTLYSLDTVTPRLDPACWVAPTADVMGNVAIEADASVWFQTVIRGDNELIRIGQGSNIQDGCVLHTDPGFPITVGPSVTVGHKVMLHGCEVGARSLIGMGAIILNGAVIGEDCLIGAGALIPEGKQIPPGSVVLGAPGKVVREVGDKDREMIRRATESYQARWRRFAEGMAAVEVTVSGSPSESA
ncbi:MAG: gamma carbonic anhydrase family protein [Pseudomonadota bacterium]